ncbi:MAG: response regulator transcription factor [Planctomycetia bacterium]|nr:response regulator transcription factor [Planctomycetia bacterium]
MSLTTVLIVDDHAFFRRSLRALLERCESLRVVGEAADGLEAIELAAILTPEVVVMDIHMPRLDGISASSILKQTHPFLKVVLYSAHARELERATQAQAADACVTKDDVFDALVPCLQRFTTAPSPSPRPSVPEED